MSFDHVFSINSSDNLAKINNSDGTTVTTKSWASEVEAVGRDKQGYVYVYAEDYVRKLNPGDLSEVWKSSVTLFNAICIKPGGPGNDVYVTGEGRVYRFEKDTGDLLWENYITSGLNINDITTDGTDLFVNPYAEPEAYRIDPSTGSESDEVDIADSNTNAGGFAYYDGLFHINNRDDGEYNKTKTWEIPNFVTNLGNTDGAVAVDTDGIYIGGYGEVWKLKPDGTVIWNQTSLGQYTKYIDTSPDSVWVRGEGGELHRLNPDTGEKIWTNSSQISYSLSSIGGYPCLDMYQFKSGTWFPTTQLSGSVKLNSTGVDSATVYIIDTDTSNLLTTVTTDSSGNWSTDVIEGRQYHITAEYEDGSGNLYNGPSYPFIDT